MNAQTIAVILIGAACAAYLIRRLARPAERAGCACGGCPAAAARSCGGKR